ncbi:MAG: hypothetical protein NXI27_23750 [Alphaproteobacteria bacterium]|nr:hypothetical protein [Alphaproteobacteria bacterium]
MDRFRDLERAGQSARKDASLLAAIAGFEALHHPTSVDRRQFSDLFLALFPHTQDETKRTAAAALSRLPDVPESVSATIAEQPVRVAAPFLALSDCASDTVLLTVIARHGVGHGRAISRRKALSEPVITALVSLDDIAIMRSLRVRGTVPTDDGERIDRKPELRARNEEALRTRLKGMALDIRQSKPNAVDQKDTLGKLLVMQAASPNRLRFADCLALALRSNASLTDRIMLDISGRQLAVALRSLPVSDQHAVAVLEGVFPHLQSELDGVSHSRMVLESCDQTESIRKVDAWRRANEDADNRKALHQPLTVDIPHRVSKLPSDRPVTTADRSNRTVRHQARRA